MSFASVILLVAAIFAFHTFAKDVRGEYKMRTRFAGGEEFRFRASHAFLRKVQRIVSTYNFAKFNGEEYSVSGLPDMYGAKVSIVYASGERIYARDNQSNFLPMDALIELVRLFLTEKR